MEKPTDIPMRMGVAPTEIVKTHRRRYITAPTKINASVNNKPAGESSFTMNIATQVRLLLVFTEVDVSALC